MKRKTSDVHVWSYFIIFFFENEKMKKRTKEEAIEENPVVYPVVWLSLTFAGWLGTASFKSDPIKPFKDLKFLKYKLLACQVTALQRAQARPPTEAEEEALQRWSRA